MTGSVVSSNRANDEVPRGSQHGAAILETSSTGQILSSQSMSLDTQRTWRTNFIIMENAPE